MFSVDEGVKHKIFVILCLLLTKSGFGFLVRDSISFSVPFFACVSVGYFRLHRRNYGLYCLDSSWGIETVDASCVSECCINLIS